jgi:hypothetical protein
MRPLQHVLGQTLIQELPLEEKADHSGGEVLTDCFTNPKQRFCLSSE